MSLRPFLLAALLAGTPSWSAAQHRGAAAPAAPFTAPPEASQFDFLVGQWELVVMPKVNSLAARIHGQPKLLGTWKAWRAFDGFGIEDELRIVDGSGNPATLSHAMRAWSAAERQWLVTSLDAYRGRFGSSSGAFAGGQMVLTGRGTDADGKPMLTRTRFSGITATAFRMQQDRSTDAGKTWVEGALTIEAKRVAAQAPR